MPQVPSRPLVAQVQEQNKLAGVSSTDLPKIPSRPSDKRSDQSNSLNQDNYARSPLNEAPSKLSKNRIETQVSAINSAGTLDTEICHLSSVKLPSIGQEGTEYADIYESKEENLNIYPTNFNNISSSSNSKELELIHPNAKIMSHAITMDHTDSSEHSVLTTSSKKVGSVRQLSEVGTNTQGIPQIGLFVPMYPNAGNVQAPSQSLTVKKTTGYSSDDLRLDSKDDSQKFNGRGQEIPSDAYGRYGHGFISQDLFDKAYYKKHPELFKKEISSYGETRPEWALSSEDLNKIVQDTASYGTGVGSSIASFGAPSEQVGFKASEKYISRISSPYSQAGHDTLPQRSSSPRNENSSTSKSGTTNFDLTAEGFSSQSSLEKTLATENLYLPDVIHIDDPLRNNNDYSESTRPVSASDRIGPDAELEPSNENHHYEAPILAPDEVAKQSLDRELQPAVFPMNKNVETYREEPIYTPKSIYNNLLNKSSANLDRSSCSSPSITSVDLTRYEPLFPEEEGGSVKTQKPSKSFEALKHPEISHRFPGQDVWEDTPSSLQYTTTVSAPQLPEENEKNETVGIETETLAHTFARRQEEIAEQGVRDLDKILHQKQTQNPQKADGKSEPKTLSETTNHRFPSRDIWEDTPDSLLLQTTVASSQIEHEALNCEREQNNSLSKENSKSKKLYVLPKNDEYDDDTSSEHKIPSKSISTTFPALGNSTSFLESSHSTKSEPLVQPLKKSYSNSPPISTQTKSKPQVPARPSRLASRDSSGNCSPALPTLHTEVTGKAKPQIPSRPMGSKIAALQGGFMLDLNKRLQLGPQGSKVSKDEDQQDDISNAPLLDPRKGRARGPARRAPKKTNLPDSMTNKNSKDKDLGISSTLTIWSYDPELEFLRVS